MSPGSLHLVLTWSDTKEAGVIKFPKGFRGAALKNVATTVHALDAMQDWIEALQNEYDATLKAFLAQDVKAAPGEDR